MQAKRILSLLLAALFVLPMAALFAVTPLAGSYPGTLQFRPDHTFKIVQFADIHSGEGGSYVSDRDKRFLQAVVHTEQPDLIVLTGDNIFSTKSNSASRDAIRSFMDVFAQFGIPVAPVFGNHDAESTAASQQTQITYYNEYPFSLMTDFSGTDEYGNYHLTIRSSDGTNPYAFNLWMLEAENYGGWYPVGARTQTWMTNKNTELKGLNGGRQVPSIVFKHIVPYKIREWMTNNLGGSTSWGNYNSKPYYVPMAANAPNNEANYMGEDPCPPNKGSTSARDSEWPTYKNNNVLGIINGHDHYNNFRIQYDGMTMVNTGQIRTGVNISRVITLHEDRQNLSFDDVDTRTIQYDELNARGLINPVGTIHNPGAWQVKIPATCTQAGTEVQYCTVCGAQTATRTVANGAHVFGAWTVSIPAKCNATGLEQATCTLCGAVETRVIPATNTAHVPGDRVTIPATCVATGMYVVWCAVCSEAAEQRVLPINPDNHAWNDWARTKEPTCALPGEEQRTCRRGCGAVEKRAIPAAGADHVPGGWEVTQEPTCAQAGTEVQKCTVCGTVVNTREIAKLDHTPASTWTQTLAPTCTEPGAEVKKCTVCNAVVATNPIAATGHNPGEWVTTTPPTCVAQGEKVKKCTVCQAVVETGSINATGHTPGDLETVEATCVAAGGTVRKCAVCHEILENNTIPATGQHTPGGWIVTRSATCAAAGEREQKCSVCNAVINTDVIAATGQHTPGGWIVTRAATCAAAGTQEKKCTVCSAVVETGSIDKLGHTPGNWATTRAATCTAAGEKEQKCTVCKAVVATEAIPAAGHTPGGWETTKQATSTEDGEKAKKCTACGVVLERETIPATGTPSPKTIFTTRYAATPLNWILFFLCFGWIWMWF